MIGDFTLGWARTESRLEIHWTNGLVERFADVDANQLVTIREGGGIAASKLSGLKERLEGRYGPDKKGATTGSSPRPIATSLLANLELQFRSQLENARIKGRGYVPEVRVGNAGIESVELRVVEGIE